jgi:biopolymer transport protein TolQ
MEDAAIESAALAGSVSGDLSMMGLFLMADPVVKLVMALLLLASVWSWAIMFQKHKILNKLVRRARRFEEAFWSGESLTDLYERVKKSEADPMLNTFSAGMDEWQKSSLTGMPKTDNLRLSLYQRIERALSVSMGREMQELEKGMTFLASIGSTAPFIGLFGTVWGIMNSFVAIAGAGDTSLSVVAPGIAEALFATALGLVAAIPAVLGFNFYSRQLNGYGDRLDYFVSEFLSTVSRHLDR